MDTETNQQGDIQTNLRSGGVSGGFPADLLVTLDRARPRSLRVQLERGLRDAIASGSLAPGAALPPSRLLARELDVSRSVVVDAYEQLVAEGYLQARRGSGTRVRGDATSERGRRPDRPGVPFWPVSISPDGRTPASGLPDPSLFPRHEWLRHVRTTLREMPDSGLLYPEPRGARELRSALASYLGRGPRCARHRRRGGDLRRVLPSPHAAVPSPRPARRPPHRRRGPLLRPPPPTHPGRRHASDTSSRRPRRDANVPSDRAERRRGAALACTLLPPRRRLVRRPARRAPRLGPQLATLSSSRTTTTPNCVTTARRSALCRASTPNTSSTAAA